MMDGWIGWVGSLQQRLDGWSSGKKETVSIPLPRWQWGWRWQWQWPWKSDRERKEKLDEEYKRRKEQIESLCRSLKAVDVTDLKDILSAMILSECVYKVCFVSQNSHVTTSPFLVQAKHVIQFFVENFLQSSMNY
jgi:hypothetical protein